MYSLILTLPSPLQESERNAITEGCNSIVMTLSSKKSKVALTVLLSGTTGILISGTTGISDHWSEADPSF